MSAMKKPSIVLKEVDRFPEPDFTDLVRALLWSEAAFVPASVWTDRSVLGRDDENRRSAAAFELRLGAYQGSSLVGWSHGFRLRPGVFLMASSAVLPEFRRRGIYSHLVAAVLERAHAAGHDEIVSKHTLTNNAVLIAKLKIGFMVAGMEVHECHGVLLTLRYLFNARQAGVFDVRAGGRRADSELARHLLDGAATCRSTESEVHGEGKPRS